MSTVIQFLIVIGAILLGTRFGGMGIGIISCLGLGILTLFFGVTPGALPADVCFIILCVCTCSAVIEQCGGLDLLTAIGAKILRKHPKHLTTLAPLVMFFLTFFAGTAMVCFALQPVIFEVAYRNGIRPERAMVTGTMAAQCAITASPISAATAAMIGLFIHYGHPEISLPQILMVSLPAGLIGVLATSLFFMKWGKELDKDEEFQRRLKNGQIESPKIVELKDIGLKGKFSLGFFLLGLIYIVLAGIYPELRTPYAAKQPMGMAATIELTMLLVGAILVIVCRPSVKKLASSQILQSAVTTMVCIVGCTWLADSFVAANKDVLLETFGSLVQAEPWTFAFALFLMAAIMNSQGATTRAIMPLGFALGLSPLALIAMYPAVNGFALFPINGPAIAACSLDRSGTTTMGKYLIDNPFQIFGTICAVISVSLGFLIVWLL